MMASSENPDKQPEQRSTTFVLFRLYIAGTTPNSLEAIANLTSICEEYLPNNYQIVIIDVFEDPQSAISAGVYVTPTLVKVSPGKIQQLVGNLRARATVILALGLKEVQR